SSASGPSLACSGHRTSRAHPMTQAGPAGSADQPLRPRAQAGLDDPGSRPDRSWSSAAWASGSPSAAGPLSQFATASRPAPAGLAGAGLVGAGLSGAGLVGVGLADAGLAGAGAPAAARPRPPALVHVQGAQGDRGHP